MEFISKTLFWIANSLLVPVIILLIVLFVRSLILSGVLYGQYLTKKKSDKEMNPKLNGLTPQALQELKASLPEKDNSLFISYLRKIFSNEDNPAHRERLLANFEIDADKDLAKSKTLTKLGPILGLMGTLIAMSPALVGLSSGDISGMAYNMQVVFATTVVGLLISAVGFITQQVKQRWYLQDITNLEFVHKIINERDDIREEGGVK